MCILWREKTRIVSWKPILGNLFLKSLLRLYALYLHPHTGQLSEVFFCVGRCCFPRVRLRLKIMYMNVRNKYVLRFISFLQLILK